MKHVPSITTATIAFLALGATPATSKAQTYQLNQPLPNIGFGIGDLLGHTSGVLIIPDTGMTGTITINPTAQTIDIAGSFSIGPSSDSVTWDETRMISAFPNPPQSVPGELTVTLACNAQTLSFDTGAQPLTWNGQFYAFNGFLGFTIPVTTSFSLVTGGNTYTGSGTPTANISFSLGPDVNTSGYPNSITLTPGPDLKGGDGVVQYWPSYTAPNGFQIEVGLVPEPSSIALGGLAVCAFIFRRKLGIR